MSLVSFTKLSLVGSLLSSCMSQVPSTIKMDLATDETCDQLLDTVLVNACTQAAATKREYMGLASLLEKDEELSRYIDGFYRDFPERIGSTMEISELLALAAHNQVIFSGDIHSDHEVTATHLRLLNGLVPISRSLGVELTIAFEIDRHIQTSIDSYLAGDMDERSFRTIWNEYGYGLIGPVDTWQHWREVFNLAIRSQVEIYAVEPENAYDLSMEERDEAIATNIRRLAETGNRLIFSPYGNSHLAASHLPARLDRQNISNFVIHTLTTNALHWQAAAVLGNEAIMKNTAFRLGKNAAYLFPDVSLNNRYLKLKSVYTHIRDSFFESGGRFSHEEFEAE